jgi:hypothetical protein
MSQVTWRCPVSSTTGCSDWHFDSALAGTMLQRVIDEEQFKFCTADLHRAVRPGGVFLDHRRCGSYADQSAKVLCEALGAGLDLDVGRISGTMSYKNSRKHDAPVACFSRRPPRAKTPLRGSKLCASLLRGTSGAPGQRLTV